MRIERSNRGQAVVEFALVLPVLLLLIFGIMEFGRMMWAYTTIAHSSREGMRYAILHGSNSPLPVGPGSVTFAMPDSDSTITSLVQSRSAGLAPNKVTVLATWPDGDSVRGSRVVVEVRYVFESIIGSFLRIPVFTMSSISSGQVQY